MCGLAGIVGRFTAAEAAALDTALAHRGPDGRGTLAWSRSGGTLPAVPSEGTGAILVHRRLAVMDPTPGGAQPMSDAGAGVHIVFNGEIYNHQALRRRLEEAGIRFSTRCDTEVLLQAWATWGQGCLPDLDGMFAFAILDTRQRILVIARDRFGIKPLYWRARSGSVAFASEIGALLTIGEEHRRIRAQETHDFLAHGLTDHHEATLLEGVRHLPPGHLLELPLDAPAGTPRPWTRRAAWPLFPAPTRLEAAQELGVRFLAAVRSHLVADVPVGFAISGGTDSSAIIAAARQSLGADAALTGIGFCADDPTIGEERWIRQAAAAVGAEVAEVRAEPGELARDADDLVLCQGEPFGSTSIYAQYRVFRRARELGLKVMIDGQGADELLGGYTWSFSARLATLLAGGHWAAAARLLRAIPRGRDVRGLGVLRGAIALALPGHRLRPRILSRRLPWLSRRWLCENAIAERPLPAAAGPEFLRSTLLQATTMASLPMLLRYEDRNSMRHGVESRVPFCSAAFAGYALALPEEYLVDDAADTKAVFRDAMRGLVPDAILDRREKIGFATPEARWMRALAPWCETVLRDADPRRSPFLDLPAFTQRWRRVVDGSAPYSQAYWRVFSLLRWQTLLGVEP